MVMEYLASKKCLSLRFLVHILCANLEGPAVDDIELDIDDLVEKMNQQRDLILTDRPDMFIIPKVREQTRAVRGREYTPHYVPIGPYHWASSSPRMKDKKLAYLGMVVYYVCRRRRITGDDQNGVVVRDLLREMENLESEARRCYTDRLDDGIEIGKEFVLMLLLDGCYLVSSFALTRNNNAREASARPQQDGPLAIGDEDGVVSDTRPQQDGPLTTGVEDGVVRDTFYLLENQIPFVAVQRIYAQMSEDRDTCCAELLRKFEARAQEQLQDLLYISKTNRPQLPPEQTPYHLLHLVRTYFKLTNRPEENGATASTGRRLPLPPQQTPYPLLHLVRTYFKLTNRPEENGAIASTGRWHRATEYCSYANVQFDQRDFNKDKEWTVLDVSLQDGKLLVPRLRVDNKTWTILRNLMALEEHQASRELRRDVTAYCLFMSQVACTAEDVALLAKRGVVEHFVGSDAEAAAGFADLCKGVVLNIDDIDSNYLKPTWHELERRYTSRRHNLEAWFRQTHCRNLWYAAAFAVAVILFASEVLQGIYAVIGDGK